MTTISTKEVDRAGSDIAAALAAGVTVNGTSGNDIITPTETIPGQPYPGNDDDTIYGLAGNDTIDGGAGADQMCGGTGNDTFYVDNAGDRVFELQGQAQGRDRVFSSVSYSLAGQFIETLTLTGDADINASGNSQANILDGNAGNNILDGGAGADLMRGGAGDDTYVVDHAADRITEIDETGADAGGLDTVRSSISFALTGLNYIENLTLTGTEAIDGTGNTLGNVLTGNAAANALDGGAGDDTLWGHEGDDTLNGGLGDDTLWGQDGDDTLDGGAHSDALWGQDGNDMLDGGIGADLMDGGAGDDTYYLDDAGDMVVERERAGNDQIFSSVSCYLSGEFIETVYVETVTLTGTDDISAWGNREANTLIGNSGSNAFRGEGGADVMRGGAGDDTYLVDSNDDVVDETDGAGGDAGGVDRISVEVPDGGYISISLTGLAAYVEDVDIYSRDPFAVVDVTGNDLNNRLICQADPQASVTLDGSGGDDELRGGNRDDQLYGGDGNDDLEGGGGSDQLHGGAGQDILYGGIGSGADMLYGDAGQDILIGGSYNSDQLTGGSDADIFQFDISGPAAGGRAVSTLDAINTITDFSRADGDRIDVTSSGAAGTLALRGEVNTPGFALTEGAMLGGDDIDPGYTQLWSYRDEEAVTTYLIGDVNDNRTLDSADLVVALTGPTAPLGLAESDFVDGTFVTLG